MAAHEDLLKAARLAQAGDWQAAHAIVQHNDGNAIANWLHALIHKVEGDDGNARYWYRRAGHGYDDFDDAAVELEAIKKALTL